MNVCEGVGKMVAVHATGGGVWLGLGEPLWVGPGVPVGVRGGPKVAENDARGRVGVGASAIAARS